MLSSLSGCVAQTNATQQLFTNQEPIFTNTVRSSSPYITNVIPGVRLDILRKIKPSFEAVVESKDNYTFPDYSSANLATVQLSEIRLKTRGGHEFAIMERNPGTNFIRLSQYLEAGKQYQFPKAILDAEKWAPPSKAAGSGLEK